MIVAILSGCAPSQRIFYNSSCTYCSTLDDCDSFCGTLCDENGYSSGGSLMMGGEKDIISGAIIEEEIYCDCLCSRKP